MVSFQTPQGVKDEIFIDYEIKQNIIKKINDIFKNFAYREVFTPTIEYYDVFSNIKSTVLKDEMFKLIDKSGDILVLRPDVTIPISRIVANNYKNSKKDFKVFYTTQVFRTNDEKRREFTQTGIEYFGNDEPESDSEVIAVAIKSLLKNDIKFHIEIGHADYYKGLLEEANLKEETEEKLKELIENKNFVEIERLVAQLNLDEKVKTVITEIPNLYGECCEVIESAKKLCLNDRMLKSLEDLENVSEILKDYGYSKYISIDLGLINHLDYYTGVIFKGYMNNYGEIILSGGRYDSLTEYYGEHIPATGFGINIDELISGIIRQNGLKDDGTYIDYKIFYDTRNRKGAFELANIMRDKDLVVELVKYDNNIDLSFEQNKDAKQLLVYDKNNVKIIDMDNNDGSVLELNDFIKIF
ncbi:ATP phosphoribosyltransferase regulatory subunit [Gottschalkia purinilytica]|uniref:ATP phosphoribosyltransferase regulatory subunit n=1 Tax=Gottschalkia purinilytica TaxID=1503 RepID=A0A0L0WFB7_GOTPU|nr:ATP phosphoribosyltransferase regulatory subunit [Gottschalkia purinilytica]KNF10173.1 ATP phosphoribosyltransferase regulatory subunit [Gottschalkia purinilytica]